MDDVLSPSELAQDIPYRIADDRTKILHVPKDFNVAGPGLRHQVETAQDSALVRSILAEYTNVIAIFQAIFNINDVRLEH